MFEKPDTRRIKSTMREAVLRVEKWASDGVAIGYDEENKVVFVRYAVPGELVKVRIYKEAKDYAISEPIEILEPSPHRVEAPCPYFAMCGGCDMQMLDYEHQVEVKKDIIKETFARIGGIEGLDFTDTIYSPNPLYYRNTVTFKVNRKGDKIGFFRKDTKNIINLEKCMIAMDGINEALDKVRNQDIKLPHNFKVRTTGQGDTVVHWVKTADYEDREVYEEVTAAGRTIKYKISKDSFFQVNNSVIPIWMEKIVSFLDEDGHERIFDLYSGIGLITLFVSHFATETVGVEIAKSSVHDAIHNKELNKIETNVKFVLAPVEEKLPELGYADVMIVDPPRAGMDKKTIDVLLQMEPSKIIYSSCKASTMARDISMLLEKYEIKETVYVDMFPHTHHAEMLCLLVKKS